MSQPDEDPSRKKLTRKERRQQRKSSITLDDVHHESEAITAALSSLLLTSLPQMATPVRLLVCSIGNPGQYLNTLHSAGHTVLSALATTLAYPSFQKSRAYGNGLVSAGSEFTLWQSSSLMNVSGVGVAAAWRQFQKEGRGEEARLVVVHDELELAPGLVKVKSGSASTKGHNGLKSINGLLKGTEYTRIGVGIGRPESREPDVVAGYVLRKMSAQERGKLEGCVGKVEMELRRLREG
ncbi:peptidyl-tRNA hydrolase [Hyaloscypha variabilis F]|jgi:PTH1 family peptidyl-tRNA hydrolase|uniref:peptidyl-tRNA hydrolase n=1 Tax=Hyaloscypha variabilis (strain UAMH 11265 / GT02V1 / F) TaxID=1149755 RepID=A0A2J6RF59_HYAVF|nr:peptidyl-tRNA hydrolase [Hyaloscypha variabilis F]